MPGLRCDEIARLVRGSLLGPGEVVVDRVETLDLAEPGSLTFVRSVKFGRRWPASRASAAVVTRDVPLADLIPGFDPASPASPRPLIIVPDADLALITLLHRFAPPEPPVQPGIHPSAVVDASAKVHPTASVGPQCVIGAGAVLHEGVRLEAQVFIGAGATVGARTLVRPNVSIMHACVIGRECILHSGVVIGGDGFGFHPSPDGRGLLKIPHIGNVVIGDQVEIGACSCIDRAKFGSTTVGDGTKIDNLVQIGHGCRIGRCCVLCGQVGLAGSAVLGDGVM
ncbi:MAG: UDP-3-O-(3-hydroxymyristoyl)glucosamine N-acyltransferase, partial [Leptolyngbya sp. PLA1]|nr:UDP-3-O-(3-hydroxymyristoyl)glucosamine N-acyltransferase [Leptolyngbya sp. PLA1]